MSKITYQNKVNADGTDQGRCLPDNWNEVKESVNSLYDEVKGTDQSKTFTGNIRLDSLSGKYDYSTVRNSITIDTNYIVGGWARFLINAPSQPTVNLNGELLNVRDEGGWVDNVDLVCTITIDGPYSNTYNTLTISFREISSIQLVIPPPGSIQNFSVDSFTSTTVELSWDTEANSDDYILQRATDSGFSQNLVTLDSNLAATTYSDSGLTSDTTYYYRVAGQNSSGTGPYATTSVTTAVESNQYILINVGTVATPGNTNTINDMWEENLGVGQEIIADLLDINGNSTGIQGQFTGNTASGDDAGALGTEADPISTGVEDTTGLANTRAVETFGQSGIILSNIPAGKNVNIKVYAKDSPLSPGSTNVSKFRVIQGVGSPSADFDVFHHDTGNLNWVDLGTYQESSGIVEFEFDADVSTSNVAYFSAALITIS